MRNTQLHGTQPSLKPEKVAVKRDSSAVAAVARKKKFRILSPYRTGLDGQSIKFK